MMHVFPIRGIRDKLVISFTALIAAIALFVLVLVPSKLERAAMQSTMEKARAVAEMASFSLAAGLTFDDTVAVNDVLAGAAVARDVAFLSVWGETGLVAQHGSARPPIDAPQVTAGRLIRGDTVLLTVVPVEAAGRRVGTLAVGTSLLRLHADVRDARLLGAGIAIAIFLGGLAAILAISTFVTRPLREVAGTVRRIAAGDLRTRAAETPDVEVRTFVRAFNAMIDTLAHTQAELAAANSDLEARVAARTAELSEASRMLQTLIDVAPQAIIACDPAYRIVRWNRAAERLLGWTAAEVSGGESPVRRFLEQGVEKPIEAVVTRKDGTTVTVLLSASALADAGGKPREHIALLTDLTERKKLEGQLRQSQKMEAVGRLAGGIAHDFNNILTIITACTELLMAAAKEGEERTLIEHISGATARATALTRQLLTFTRQQVTQPRPIDIGAVIGALEPMLRRVLPANIHLSTVLPRGLGRVVADASQVEQVVMNLVMNASDAMPDGGTLAIELAPAQLDTAAAAALELQPGPHLRLVVRDTGTGIDESVLSRIFDPFFTTKDVGKGTGLGLATVYGIMSSLRGEIHATSAIGEGTTFIMHFPLCIDCHVPEPGSGPTSRLLPTPSDAKTVVLVEDEPLVRQIVQRSLERAGYEVFVAGDGEEALGFVARHRGRLDAIVTDMMMPGMSGKALTEMLRTTHPDLGVVYISGYTESEIGDGAELDDRHVFLQKPFSNRQLLAAVAGVTRADEATLA